MHGGKTNRIKSIIYCTSLHFSDIKQAEAVRSIHPKQEDKPEKLKPNSVVIDANLCAHVIRNLSCYENKTKQKTQKTTKHKLKLLLQSNLYQCPAEPLAPA